MVMEDDIKDVLVYDQATGNKYFDKVDRSGNSVPGIERRDAMFLEDYTIDTRNKIARNVNLNDTIPLVILNEGNYDNIKQTLEKLRSRSFNFVREQSDLFTIILVFESG